jgi:hypothetical protein
MARRFNIEDECYDELFNYMDILGDAMPLELSLDQTEFAPTVFFDDSDSFMPHIQNLQQNVPSNIIFSQVQQPQVPIRTEVIQNPDLVQIYTHEQPNDTFLKDISTTVAQTIQQQNINGVVHSSETTSTNKFWDDDMSNISFNYNTAQVEINNIPLHPNDYGSGYSSHSSYSSYSSSSDCSTSSSGSDTPNSPYLQNHQVYSLCWFKAFEGKRMTDMHINEFLERVGHFHNLVMHEFQLPHNEQILMHMRNIMGAKWTEVLEQLTTGNAQLEQLIRAQALQQQQTQELYQLFERRMNAGETDLKNSLIYNESQTIRYYCAYLYQQGDPILNEQEESFREMKVKSKSPIIMLESKSSSGVSKKKKKKLQAEHKHKHHPRTLPSSATTILQQWYDIHSEDPYPKAEEKKMLMEQTKLSLRQINNWFVNHRCRDKNRIRDSDKAKENSTPTSVPTPESAGQVL